MDNGRIDCMSEWPLLCGLSQAEAMQNSTDSDRVIVAVRGTNNDGIVSSVTEAIARLDGPDAEMREFSDQEEAEEWIHEKHKQKKHRVFYAVRGGKKDGIVMTLEEARAMLVGRGAEWESFQTKNEAQKWIDEMKAIGKEW